MNKFQIIWTPVNKKILLLGDVMESEETSSQDVAVTVTTQHQAACDDTDNGKIGEEAVSSSAQDSSKALASASVLEQIIITPTSTEVSQNDSTMLHNHEDAKISNNDKITNIKQDEPSRLPLIMAMIKATEPALQHLQYEKSGKSTPATASSPDTSRIEAVGVPQMQMTSTALASSASGIETLQQGQVVVCNPLNTVLMTASTAAAGSTIPVALQQNFVGMFLY